MIDHDAGYTNKMNQIWLRYFPRGFAAAISLRRRESRYQVFMPYECVIIGEKVDCYLDLTKYYNILDI